MARAATARCCARRWGCWAEAGWTVTDEGLTNAAGEQFAFTISVQNKDQEKIALHYQRTLAAIGIKAEVRLVNSAQFAAMQRSYDYDMIPATWFNSLSPGNEQMLYFGSDGRTCRGHAQLSGHRRSAHVDAAIAAMLNANDARGFRGGGQGRGPLAGVGLLHGAVLRCRRAMGGAVELYRPTGAAAAPRLRSDDAVAHSVSFTGEMPPARLNLAPLLPVWQAGGEDGADRGRAATERWTYGALEDAVLRLGQGLARSGLEPGERLFIRMGNSLDYALVFLAANAIGAVPIPASPMLTAREVSGLLNDSGASHLAWDRVLDLPGGTSASLPSPRMNSTRLKRSPIGTYADTAADDPGYLIYTSGTTERPKGVLHGHRAVWGRRPMYQGWYGIGPMTSCCTPAPSTGPIRWVPACLIPSPTRQRRWSIPARPILMCGGAF